jgi:TolB-like protein/Flp pilus assembly protein TadD
LFIDIVGSSKLLINEQSEVLRELNQIVRNSEQVRAAEAVGKLIRLPTGDGMALAFFTTPDAPVRCALELSKDLKNHPKLLLRMGIHSGPVDEVVDVNERSNIAGAGITMAQRVMDCGDAGHILLSKRIADDLAQYGQWRPHLHDLGACEVKHGVKIDIVNLYADGVGNPAMPDKLKKERQIAATFSRSRTLRNTALIAAAALFLAFGFWSFLHPTAPRSTTGPALLVEKRIAVLPFKPLLAENRDQVLELGMADTLIAKLSNSREIIVSSLTSVRKYGGLDQDPVAAGRALQVNSVLEGNVQKVGDRIRVTARLIGVPGGASLWAGTFDEKFTDVFSVQDAISQKVADALALQLSGDEKKRLTRRYTESVEAYQLYLTGRYHLSRLTPPEIKTSIEFFQRAIDLDSRYALAYFGLAEAHRALAITSDVRPKETMPQAKAAALKALEIDETLAEPHASLVFIHMWFDWDWAGAEKDAKRAIELNPNSGFAHVAYAHLLSDLGRHPEAISEATRARELDPVSLLINAIEGSVLYYAGRTDDAENRLRKTIELDPNFWIAHLFLGKVYLQKANYSEAVGEFTKARELSHGNSEAISMTGYTWAKAGESAKAQAVLDEFKSLSTQRYIPPFNIAVVYLGLDKRDEAFAWLDKAYEDHDVRLSFLRVDPKWNPFRSDPRFVNVLKRIGLP